MADRDRKHNIVVPVTREELDQVHHLSATTDEPIVRMVRRLLRAEYASTFGDAPAPAAKLKHDGGRKAR
jgi:hypothetical protein